MLSDYDDLDCWCICNKFVSFLRKGAKERWMIFLSGGLLYIPPLLRLAWNAGPKTCKIPILNGCGCPINTNENVRIKGRSNCTDKLR